MTKRAVSVISDPAEVADTITLDELGRHRRRMKMVSDNGIDFLLDLPSARLLQHGDGLVLEDGRIVQVSAAPEPLYEIRGLSQRHLLGLAWQIGNRHLAAELRPDSIRIRRDHVIREMLLKLGASVDDIEEVFDPEPGAYAHGHHHDHGHQHEHEHEHEHEH